PKTKPRIDKARYYEERLDVDALVQRALDGIEITEIKIGDTFLNQEKKVFAELL
ncbi:tRNA 4-thiouridine(8) synthase ThiI, partial [Lactobacillus salivarius]|nr:tRNA 4-thiouridine(8) synthase ThiI [Ligilactobacillus salivarius]